MTNSESSEDDLFFFETDHLALRGNKDYGEVIKTLFILCAQRERSLKDYNKILQMKKEALENPGVILKKLLEGESLGLPDMHRIPEPPTIDWSKYDVKIPEEGLKAIYNDEQDRTKKRNEPLIDEPSKRLSNYEKWTPEEQKRLEELLQVYPPEPVELRRYKKIAQALGNRTLQQVSSRIQKYFLKLYKAGLPIPGRIPKSAEKYKKSAMHKHQRHNHYLLKPTTFFPELYIPVVMNDTESTPGPSGNSIPEADVKPSTSKNYLMSTNYYEDNENLPKKTNVELELELLKRIRGEKVRENSQNQPQYHHLGFKCDYCNEEPIKGSRWHCVTCRSESVDFCTDCCLAQIYSDNAHPLTHEFVIYSDKETFSDFSSTQSNNGHFAPLEESDSDLEQIDSDDSDLEHDENNSTGSNDETMLDEILNNLQGEDSVNLDSTIT